MGTPMTRRFQFSLKWSLVTVTVVAVSIVAIIPAVRWLDRWLYNNFPVPKPVPQEKRQNN